MKTVTINRNAWHFRAQHQIFSLRGDPEDFCAYVRRVIWSVLVLALFAIAAIAGGCIAVYSTGDFIGWLVAGIVYGFVRIEGGVGFAAAMTAGVLALFCVGISRLARTGGALLTEHKPEFLSDAYRSIKDRICYRLEIRG